MKPFSDSPVILSFSQAKRLVTDSYVKYTQSFVASTSDFW